MSTIVYFPAAKMQRRLHEGPLGTHIDLYAARLQDDGHCLQSAWRCLRVVSDFSHWLERKGIGLAELNEQIVQDYQRFRVRYRCPFLSDQPALIRLLGLLRSVNAIPAQPPAVLSACDQILSDFRQHLRRERGLAHVSIIRGEPVVRQFLKEACRSRPCHLVKLTRTDILAFVERHVRDHSPRSAQLMCSALRSFIRYLQYKGTIDADLTSAIPSIRRWKLTSLPTYLSSAQVEKVLRACDRRTATGRRDHAILVILSRLGLRANEIATLTLDDVDWEVGALTIQAKGRKRTQVPLLPAVGNAIAEYLRRGRPPSSCRRLFLRTTAPHVGFASSAAISMIAKEALKRADIDGIAHKGAHVFRHTIATELLRARASLTEIGHVLHHQDPNTTAIYAKVDLQNLRTVGLPWPGGAQ